MMKYKMGPSHNTISRCQQHKKSVKYIQSWFYDKKYMRGLNQYSIKVVTSIVYIGDVNRFIIMPLLSAQPESYHYYQNGREGDLRAY